jgi:hypothetical protein
MLTCAQRVRLQLLHSYEWSDEDESTTKKNLDSILSSIESVEELWYASYVIQWAPEKGDLRFFYEHDLCDRGLALFLYWSLRPDSLYRAKAEGGDRDMDYWDTMKTIEARLLGGFYSAERIAFDPLTDLGPRESKSLSYVPDQLKLPTRGVKYDLDYTTAIFG